MNSINTKLKGYGLSVYKIAVVGTGIIFCIFSMVLTLYRGDTKNILYILATAALVCVPVVMGILMKFSVNPVMFTFIVFYAAAPLLGSMYKLYYLTSWWDDLLHFSGGVVFAMLGLFLAKFLNKNNKSSLMLCAVFAFCFSLAIAALWEFFEFTMDSLFGMDMQVDTVINSINSYLLGDSPGVQGSITEIESVYINGKELGVGGYIDIGLIDTMKDMMTEGMGALLYCIIFLIDRDRHPLLTPVNRKKHESA